jgi:DNA modification methylase
MPPQAGLSRLSSHGKKADGRRFDSRALRSVWTIPTHPYPQAHFATFPPRLAETCIKAGCPVGGVVLDPFSGAGTTGLVAAKLGRRYVGIELNPAYVAMARDRIANEAGLLEVGV